MWLDVRGGLRAPGDGLAGRGGPDRVKAPERMSYATGWGEEPRSG
ncbi:hypothetical protein [Streptomyces rubiginosohelvolus]